MNAKIQILNSKQIEQRINRIAYQIYEDCFDEKEIVMAGIAPNGFNIAKSLAKKLKEISNITIILTEVVIDKSNPIKNPAKLSPSTDTFFGKTVVLVDDVLNSGKTMLYGLKPFLNAPIKKIRTAVLVDRNHKTYPISADYVGLSLSTTMQEQILVDADAVYLT